MSPNRYLDACYSAHSSRNLVRPKHRESAGLSRVHQSAEILNITLPPAKETVT